jgi:oligopeptidase B
LRFFCSGLVICKLIFSIVLSRTPVLLTAYGAYGFPLDLSFDASRFALLDRGWVLAFAHVRGGGERGHSWLATGLNRPRAHEDFEACARWLRTSGWSQPSRIAVQAHSAGGLLLAVAAGRHGRNLFGAMLAHSPFVDVVNAMTLPASESSALSVHERDEWGDMLGDASIWRMWRSLAPLHNMRAAEYPHALITASVHDNRVPVADALKFAAAMREHNQAANTLTLCQINQEEGGHFGSTSFEGRVKQTALEYAFLIHTLQNGKDGSDGKDSKSIA